MYWVYIIECDNNKYYVGMTTRLLTRLNQHFNKNGSKITKEWGTKKFICAYKVCDNLDIPDGKVTKSKAEDLENEITINLMKQKGMNNVRGGIYCAKELWENPFKRLNERLICNCGLPCEKYQKYYGCPVKRIQWLTRKKTILLLPINRKQCFFHKEI